MLNKQLLYEKNNKWKQELSLYLSNSFGIKPLFKGWF